MQFLLDTHTFLWWISNDNRLSTKARKVIADEDNQLFLSTASLWEISIKARLKRLTVPKDLGSFIVQQLQENSIEALPILAAHAIRVYSLPEIHKDPFDQILISQALEEQLPIVTRDSVIRKYKVETVW